MENKSAIEKMVEFLEKEEKLQKRTYFNEWLHKGMYEMVLTALDRAKLLADKEAEQVKQKPTAPADLYYAVLELAICRGRRVATNELKTTLERFKPVEAQKPIEGQGLIKKLRGWREQSPYRDIGGIWWDMFDEILYTPAPVKPSIIIGPDGIGNATGTIIPPQTATVKPEDGLRAKILSLIDTNKKHGDTEYEAQVWQIEAVINAHPAPPPVEVKPVEDRLDVITSVLNWAEDIEHKIANSNLSYEDGFIKSIQVLKWNLLNWTTHHPAPPPVEQKESLAELCDRKGWWLARARHFKDRWVLNFDSGIQGPKSPLEEPIIAPTYQEAEQAARAWLLAREDVKKGGV